MTCAHDPISFLPTCDNQNNGKQQKLQGRPKSTYLRMTKSPRRFLASNAGTTPSHFYHVQYPYIIEPVTIIISSNFRKEARIAQTKYAIELSFTVSQAKRKYDLQQSIVTENLQIFSLDRQKHLMWP